MRNLQALFVAWSKRFKPLLPLIALMLIAVLLTFLLSAGASGGATLHLFESPVVSPPLPEEPEAPAPVVEPSPTSPAEAPREAVPSPPPAPEEPEAPAPVVEPSPTPPAEAPREAVPSPTPLPQEPSAEEPIQPTAAPTSRPRARPTEPPSVVLDRGLLIDSILVYMSWIWLCCGILAMLGIPLIFLILHVWGSQRRRGRAAKKRP